MSKGYCQIVAKFDLFQKCDGHSIRVDANEEEARHHVETDVFVMSCFSSGIGSEREDRTSVRDFPKNSFAKLFNSFAKDFFEKVVVSVQ